MGAYDCDCINNLEYERSKRRKKLFHITPQKQNNGCILTEFGDCSYNETGCSDCAIKQKIKTALSAKESTENELIKPCPFCGEKAKLKESHGYYVQCDNEKCAVSPATKVYVIKDRAIMAWNQRALIMELCWLLNNVNDNSRNNTISKGENNG